MLARLARKGKSSLSAGMMTRSFAALNVARRRVRDAACRDSGTRPTNLPQCGADPRISAAARESHLITQGSVTANLDALFRAGHCRMGVKVG
jgi:hypothetical protein